jgi:hypothetical protein
MRPETSEAMIRYSFFGMISGVAVMIIGFLYAMYFVGLPYPEMTQAEQIHEKIAGKMWIIGFFIVVGSIFAMLVSLLFKIFRKYFRAG